MVVHPGAGNRRGTLVHALPRMRLIATVGGAGRPGIVHRLDKAFGAAAVAKTPATYLRLVEAIARREVKREYSLVWGAARSLRSHCKAGWSSSQGP
jgi:23S rRNA pseudouridine1911/1915/1917 synthase